MSVFVRQTPNPVLEIVHQSQSSGHRSEPDMAEPAYQSCILFPGSLLLKLYL